MTYKRVKGIQTPSGFYARDLFSLAKVYLDAFAALESVPTLAHSKPRFQLLSHAVEIGLKSFLASTGMDEGELKKLGHRLDAIFRRCAERGLPGVPDLNHLIRHLNNVHWKHRLRYPSGYVTTVPHPHECQQVMNDLFSVIGEKIEFAASLASLKYASDTSK